MIIGAADRVKGIVDHLMPLGDWFLHQTNSSTSGSGGFPLAPLHSPKTARHNLQNDPFSLKCFQKVKVILCNHKYPH